MVPHAQNIERYVSGMGLKTLAPKSYTSKDETIGAAGTETNTTFLRATLLNIYQTIKTEKLELPGEAVVPEAHHRELPTIGEPTQQRVQIESARLADADTLRTKVDERRAEATSRRGAAGSSTQQRRRVMPEITDALIGREVEVAWTLTYNIRGGGSKSGVFWCAGKIEAVSDETTSISTGRGNSKVGAGWIYVAYDMDSEDGSWLKADRPTFWNATKPGSWRWKKDGNNSEDEESGEESGFDGATDASDDDDGADQSDDNEET